MAREATPQEAAQLKDIRSTREAVQRDISSLSAQRAEVGRRIRDLERDAAPGAEIARLRQESQSLSAREQSLAADRLRLSREELAVGQEPGPSGAASRPAVGVQAAQEVSRGTGAVGAARQPRERLAGDVRPVVAQVSRMDPQRQFAILSTLQAQLNRQLLQEQAAHRTVQEKRRERIAALAKRIKPTVAVFFFGVLAIAAAFDLFEFVKDDIAAAIGAIPAVGWVVGILVFAAVAALKFVLISTPSYFIARKVKTTSEAAQQIRDYAQTLHKEHGQLVGKMFAYARASNQMGRWQNGRDAWSATGIKNFVLYESRIVLNTLIVQLLESVPLVDVGPWATLRLIKLYIDQQKQYRQGKAWVARCQLVVSKMDTLAQIEFVFLARQLRLLRLRLLRLTVARQLPGTLGRRTAGTLARQEPVRDIGPPTPTLQPAY